MTTIVSGLTFTPLASNQIALQIGIPDILERYIRGDFLVLSLVLGYLLVFLFFHGNEEPAKTHWASVEWGERFFLGLLLGMLLLFLFSIVTSSYYLIAQSILLEPTPDPFLIWFAWSWIVGSVSVMLRLLAGGPLHGSSGQRILGRICSAILKPVIWFIPLVFLFLTGYFSLFYPFNSGLLSSVWFTLSFWFFLAVALCLWFPAYVFYLLSMPMMPKLNLKMPDFSLNSLWKLIRQRFTIKTLKWVLKRFASDFRRNQGLLKGIALVVMLSVSVVMYDAQFGVFSPHVSRVQTTIAPSYTLEGTLTNYVVTVHVNKTYYIESPHLWVIRNITFANPSNFSFSETPGADQIRSSVKGANIKRLTVTNASGSIESFELYFYPSQTSYVAIFSTDYQDRVGARLLNVSYGVNNYLGNNTYQQTINIKISNPLDKTVFISNLYVGEYPNILNVTCTANNQPTTCYNYSPQRLWLMPLTLDKGQSLTIQLSVVFRYGG